MHLLTFFMRPETERLKLIDWYAAFYGRGRIEQNNHVPMLDNPCAVTFDYRNVLLLKIVLTNKV